MTGVDEALLTGTVALLVWFLSRFRAFTTQGRLEARIEADLRIVDKLPESPVRARLVASVEADVERLLDGRSRMEVWAQTPKARTVERVVVGVAGLASVGISVWLTVLVALNWPQPLLDQVIALAVLVLVLWQFGWAGGRAIWRAVRRPVVAPS